MAHLTGRVYDGSPKNTGGYMLSEFKRYFFFLGISLLFSFASFLQATQLDNSEGEGSETLASRFNRKPGKIIFHGMVHAGPLSPDEGQTIPDGTVAEVIPFLIGPHGERQTLDPIPGVFINNTLRTNLITPGVIAFSFDPVRLQFETYHVGIAFKAAINEQLPGAPQVSVALQALADVKWHDRVTSFFNTIRYRGQFRLNLTETSIEVIVPLGFTKKLIKEAESTF